MYYRGCAQLPAHAYAQAAVAESSSGYAKRKEAQKELKKSEECFSFKLSSSFIDPVVDFLQICVLCVQICSVSQSVITQSSWNSDRRVSQQVYTIVSKNTSVHFHM
jgi:hypothetical protein